MRLFLIHGMGRTPLSLALLGRRLSRRGHAIEFFSYTAFRESFDQIVRRLIARVRASRHDQSYALIGHSLGGILARAALPALAVAPPRYLVMLAPPNQAPLLAQRLRQNPLYRIMTGECGRKLADRAFYDTLPHPAVPTTIIAGTAGPRGRLSPFGDLLNDGVVAVEETCLDPEAEVILIPAVHTFIMNSPQVARVIGDILRES